MTGRLLVLDAPRWRHKNKRGGGSVGQRDELIPVAVLIRPLVMAQQEGGRYGSGSGGSHGLDDVFGNDQKCVRRGSDLYFDT